jgi:hypothetical protein
MIRVVLAVVLTTALLGASLPAIDEARRDHTETTVGTELRAIERVATDLLNTDDPTEDGARRVIEIRLPARSWSDAGVDAVTIGQSRAGNGGRLTWTTTGGRQRVRRLPDVPLRTGDGTPLTLEAAGRHRLVLSLDGNRTAPVVTVRTFTNDDGASEAHATVVTDRRRRSGRRVHV